MWNHWLARGAVLQEHFKLALSGKHTKTIATSVARTHDLCNHIVHIHLWSWGAWNDPSH